MKTFFTTATLLIISGCIIAQMPEKHLIFQTHSGDYAGLQTADLNNDGTDDFLMWDTHQYKWTEMNGDTTWSAEHVITTPFIAPSTVSVVDVNGDGLLDIFYLTNTYPRAAGWLENPGDGVDYWLQHSITNNYNYLIGVFDVDNDSDADFVYENNLGALGYFENIGGEFTITHAIPDTYPAINGVTINDFDKDGDTDFVLYFYDCCIKYFTNTGLGTFTVSTISTSEYEDDIYSGDTNGDGYADVVYHYGASFYIATFNPVTSLFNAYTLIGSINISFMKLTDLDGDGDDDWAIFDYTAGEGHYHLNWIENTGAIDPLSETLLMDSVSNDFSLFAFADINQDGIQDLVTTDKKSLLVNPALGVTPGYGPAYSPETTILRFDLARVYDVNNDGRDDIMMASADGVLGWLDYDPVNDTLLSYRLLPNMTSSPLPKCIRENDLDNDGDQDLVASFTSTYGGAQISYYFLNNGTGTFTMHEFSDICLQKIWFSDVDNDGDNDMIGVEDTTTKNLRLFLNSGDTASIFNSSAIISASSAQDYDMTDMDADGDDDFIYTISGSIQIKKIMNNGDGTFAAPVLEVNASCSLPTSVYVSDFDADGDNDIMYSCSSNNMYLAEKDGASYTTVSATTFRSESPVAPTYSAHPDINNDGISDAMLSNYDFGTFAKISMGPDSFLPGSFQVSPDYGITCDLNNNGLTDFIGTNNSELYVQYDIMQSIPSVTITSPTISWLAENGTPDSIEIFANAIPESALIINITPGTRINAGAGAGNTVSVTLEPDSTSLLPHTIYFNVPDNVSVDDISTSHVIITADPATWGPYVGAIYFDDVYTITDNDLGFFRDAISVTAPETGTPVYFNCHFNKVFDAPTTVTITPDADFSVGFGLGTPYDIMLPAGIAGINEMVIPVNNLPDYFDEDPITEYVHFNFTSDIAEMNDFTTIDEQVILNDNDASGITRITPGTTHYTEGTEHFYITLGLTSAPTADVFILMQPDEQLDMGNGAGVPLLVDFVETGTLPVNQVIEGLPVNDFIPEASHTGIISFTVTSTDLKYDVLTLSNVSIHIDDAAATGMAENTQVPVSVYPSIGSGLFTVSTDNPDAGNKLVVYNAEGQIVLTGDMTAGNTYSLDLTQMTAGNYFVAIYNTTGAGIMRVQVVK